MVEKYHKLQQAIIGTLVNWPHEIDTACRYIDSATFIHPSYRQIFEWLVANEHEVNFVNLGLAFQNSISEIMCWCDEQVTSAFLPQYCRDLKEASRKVALLDLASMVKAAEHKTSVEITEMIESALSVQHRQYNEPSLAQDLVKSIATRLEERQQRGASITGMPYGYSELDKATQGMHRGDLVIVAGRPSMGKTALGLNIFENVCHKGGSALFFSLEMSKDQLVDRMVASKGRIKFQSIRSGNFADHDWDRLTEVCQKMFGWKFAIDDTPGISLADIKRKARKFKKRYGLDVLIIDYLQLMRLPLRENRVQAIGEVSRGLKQLARELEITIMALSQLNRGVDSRPDKRPTMSDLRDSGEIEQDADVILFPFRPAAYCDKCRDKVDDATHSLVAHQSQAEVIIEKQRNGERNLSIPMVWHGHYQRFESLEIERNKI